MKKKEYFAYVYLTLAQKNQLQGKQFKGVLKVNVAFYSSCNKTF